VTVRLVPIPTAAMTGGLIMRVVYQPLVSTTDVDTILWTQYGDDIAKGARALLYKMAKKPWGNAQLAAEAESAFEDAIAAARLQVQRGFGRSRPRVRAHYFRSSACPSKCSTIPMPRWRRRSTRATFPAR
jgi:hypothetical protein